MPAAPGYYLAVVGTSRVVEVFVLFLRIGATAFGGPAVHLAVMRDEVVRRRGWVTDAEFLDLLAATNLIPGPNSTEMAIHLGLRRAGWWGFAAAGLAFIAPAFLVVLGLAVLYQRVGSLPDTRGVLAGIAPVVVVIVADALRAFCAGRRWTLWHAGVFVATAAGALAGMHEVALLGVAAAIGLGRSREKRDWVICGVVLAAIAALTQVSLAPGVGSGAGVPLTTVALGWFFVKVGSVLFGSGYVLFAFLRADLVERTRWLTDQQLLDAIAVGQFTPGPLSTTATFIGYVLDGVPGAVVATCAMFAPAFVFVALSHPLIPRLRQSPRFARALDAVVIASLGLMLAVVVALTRSALASPRRG